jgi:ribosome-binding protein aMBF1 (putative translation factor)
MNKNDIYDVSAELERVFGSVGSATRNKAIEEAWEDYNAQILHDARKNSRLSQAQLAERIGADKGYISRIERGLIVPSIATFYKIAAAMGLSVELRPHH